MLNRNNWVRPTSKFDSHATHMSKTVRGFFLWCSAPQMCLLTKTAHVFLLLISQRICFFFLFLSCVFLIQKHRFKRKGWIVHNVSYLLAHFSEMGQQVAYCVSDELICSLLHSCILYRKCSFGPSHARKCTCRFVCQCFSRQICVSVS